MVKRLNSSSFITDQNICDMIGFVLFIYLNNCIQSQRNFIFCFNLFFWVQAVVAISATVGNVSFSKIIQQNGAPGNRCFGIRNGVE